MTEDCRPNHCRRDCCKNHKVTTPPPFKSLEPAKRVHKRGVPVKGCGHKVGREEPSGPQCAARGGCTGDRQPLPPHVVGCAGGEAVRNLRAGLIKPGAAGRSSTSPLCRQSMRQHAASGCCCHEIPVAPEFGKSPTERKSAFGFTASPAPLPPVCPEPNSGRHAICSKAGAHVRITCRPSAEIAAASAAS